MKIKLFHTADVHIGLKYSGRDYSPELRSKLQAEPLNCLQRMVDKANESRCDLFVIAGDMFDRVSIPKSDIKKAADILKTFTGTNVLVLPGNHDFFENSRESLWNNFNEYANEHLVILLNKTEPIEILIRENKVIAYPGPCKTKHSAQNQIAWVKGIKKEKDNIHIGIAHGSIEGISPDADLNYFPMKISELKDSGVDFWLLGHTHVRYPEHGGKGNPVFFMPSTPVPDGFDCSHDGFAWLLEIDKNKVLKYESIKTGTYSFKTWLKDIYSYKDIIKLKEEILQLNADTTLMKLKLMGRLTREEISQLPGFFDEIFTSLTYVEIDAGNISLNIDRQYIDDTYSENSLPHRLLKNLESNPDNQLALQLAHQLIEEAKG